MSKTLTFSDGTHTITINAPTWPYSCEIVMPISSIKDSQGTPTFFDPPNSTGTLGTWDYRILNTGTWRIPSDQQLALSAFFQDASKGRGENVIMTLQSGSGFFPFGPDLGDTGAFTVRLLSQEQSGRLGRPWNHFENTVTLVLVSAPGGYASPSQSIEGNLSIGTVSGLQFVDYAPKTLRNIKNYITKSGAPFCIDGASAGDSYETSFVQICNNGNSAALVAYLVSSYARSNDIAIVAPSNYYFFAVDNSSNGTYTAKFLGSDNTGKSMTLKITHERYNQFSIPLSFWLKAVA